MREWGVLGRGAYLQRGQVTWRVRVFKDSVYHLENPETGEVCTISYDECRLGCVTGSIRPVAAPGAGLDAATQVLLTIPLDDLPDSMKASVMRKAVYIEAFQDLDAFHDKHFPEMPPNERITKASLSARVLKRLLPRIAQTVGDPSPPGVSTFIKWYGRWSIGKAAGNADIRVLADKLSSRGPQKALMSPRMEALLNDTIDTYFLDNRQGTRRKVFEVLREKVRQWNKAHPDEQEAMLSIRHVQRRCNGVDKYTTVSRREGKQAADRKFRPIGVGPDPLGILEIVEVDHTPLDVEVMDPVTKLSLGRPWLTVAIDKYSRVPLAAHVHFDGPSLIAVMTAIRQTLLPKTFLSECLPNLKDFLNYYGLPVGFFFDRGADFDNEHIRHVGLTLDIRLDYEPAGVPEMKGRVERFCGTLNREVCHELPGARPPFETSKDKMARMTLPVVTLEEIQTQIWKWILGKYIHRNHETLGMHPAEKWAQSAAERPGRPPRAESALGLLGTRLEYCNVTRKGIRWKYLRWNGKILEEIRRNPDFRQSDKLKIRIDDGDVGQAWVVDPVTRKSYQLEPVFSYMNGLTLYQHRMVLLLIKKKKEDAGDSEVYLETTAELNAQVDAFNARSASKSRSGNASHSRQQYGGGAKPNGVPLTPDMPPSVAMEDLDEPDPDDPAGGGNGPSRWSVKKVWKS